MVSEIELSRKGFRCRQYFGIDMKTLTFDVMLGDRYVCTLHYEYCPLFPIEERELHDFVVNKRPTLRNKNFRIELFT